MLDYSSVHQHYEGAVKGLCEGALLGLSLMTVAGLVTAFLLTLLVCVDSHTWIYLNKKYVYNLLNEVLVFSVFSRSFLEIFIIIKRLF